MAALLVAGAATALGLATATSPRAMQIGLTGQSSQAPSPSAAASTGGTPAPTTSASAEPTASRTTAGPPPSTAPSPTVSRAAPGGTQVIDFQPFAGNSLAAGLQVTQQVSGSCRESGVAGAHSYRCLATNANIYDPCFSGPDGTNSPFVCPVDPATGTVVAFTVTSTPSPAPPAACSGCSKAWAFQLPNGQVCIAANAAWGGLGPYGCQHHNETPADCHVPVAGPSSWTADCQDVMDSSSPFTPRHVQRVWTYSSSG